MIGNSLPKCPNCKEGVLIPLSAVIGNVASHVYAHWICLNCGFYFGTGGTHGYNVPKDIHIGIIPEIFQIIKEIRETKPSRAQFYQVKQQ